MSPSDPTDLGWLRSSTTDARLSLKSGVLFQDTPDVVRRYSAPSSTSDQRDYLAASLQWSATSVHESGHWARWHGSTAGVLLTSLAAGFTFTATGLLGSHAAEVRALCNEAFLNPLRLSDAAADEFGAWRESLWALHLTYDAFLNGSSRLASPPLDAVSIANTGMSDSWFHLAELAITQPWPGGEAVRQVDGPVRIVRAGDHEVSTRDLLECGAVIDEGYAFGGVGASHGGEFYEMWGLSLTHTRGGRLIQLASDLAERVVRPDEMLSLIDFALNPPIPMFEQGLERVGWEEFYPPSRFAAAARTLRDIHLHPDSVCESSIRSASEWLVERSALRFGVIDAALSHADRLSTVFEAELANHFGVLFYAARRIHELRQRFPEAVAHFGWATSGGSPFATTLLEDRLSGTYELSEVLVAPFVALDGAYQVTPPAQEISTPYILSVAALGAMRDFLLGRPAFDVGHLPPLLLARKSFREQVDGLMDQICGGPFRWPEPLTRAQP